MIEICLLVAVMAVGVPIAVLFIECCAALLPARRRELPTVDRRPSFDVLIPAHDEAAVIEATLAWLRPQLVVGDRIVVVADNCRDATADLARAAQATVVERFNLVQRGKGYALSHGVRSMEAAPREVVIVVDADCEVRPGSLERLARAAAATGRPVQGTYLMQCPADPSPRDLVSELAVTTKNLVRKRGADRLGAPCVLNGSGMAFPWPLIRDAELASGDLVEDLELTFKLLVNRQAPLFCPEAVILAPLPKQRNAALSQRTRWEHGHLQTLLRLVPRLFAQGVAQRRADLFAAAVDLAVPPVSLLAVAWGGVSLLAIAAVLLDLGTKPAVAAIVTGILLASSILVPLVGFQRRMSFWKTLAAVPLYVYSKLPIYANFLLRRQQTWVRTQRDTAAVVHPSEPRLQRRVPA